ncbi:hypothetical protein FA13DRAFT_1795884 [Coprinellus micaceus]|uniref:Uncharacterized protein n=1 Tax=Coprinellus micaceus TaxID=71717 RepID=A0A4Y7SWN4_COPMI|nr:hypothetical protein FA13DRAFT_1795884 [Coprinellus micaceus]
MCNHWALTSPARRLPGDILLNICFEALALARPLPSAHPAVVAGCICRRWREIALGAPLLWTKIVVVLPWASMEKKQRKSLFHETLRRDNMEAYLLRSLSLFRPYVNVTVERVQAFVQRSRGCPLDLRVGAEDVAQAPSSSQVFNEWAALLDPLCMTIAGPAMRWKNLTLNLRVSLESPVSLRFLQILSALSGSGMQSATLILQTHSRNAFIPEAQWDDLLPAAKIDLRLAELRVFLARMRYSAMSRIETSWDGLATLMIGAPSSAPPFLPEEALITLRRTPNLIHCKIALSFPVSHQTPDLDPLTLANVKSFTIKGYTPPRAFAEALYLAVSHSFVCCRSHGPHRNRRHKLHITMDPATWDTAEGGLLILRTKYAYLLLLVVLQRPFVLLCVFPLYNVS